MFIRHLVRGTAAFAALIVLQLAVASAAHAQSICPPLDASTLPAGIQFLEFPAAWQKACGTANVAILDNGIFVQNGAPHPALNNNLRDRFLRNCRADELVNGACLAGIGSVDEQLQPFNTRGHGTHVAGIIGASPTTSDPGTGLAAVGGCRGCSLQIVKISTNEESVVPALDQARFFGSQVINLSNGFPDNLQVERCATATCTNWRARMNELAARDVVIVAASGNSDFPGGSSAINFPANHATVIAVGGADGTAFWPPRQVTRTDVTPPATMQFGSGSGAAQWLIAPAVAIPSLFYNDHNWALFGPPVEYSCRDQHLINPSLPAGFGNCTGTSMAAPHVSAIAALMKSANPLLSAAQTREFLRQSGSAYPGWAPDLGYGIPSAAKAVNLALGASDAVNRLTPLFSLAAVNSPFTNIDHLYTVVPQVAMSSIEGTLPAQPLSALAPFNAPASYRTYGTPVPGYASFPGCASCASQTPTAIASVFTTHRNPVAGAPELSPLYRMSWQCPTAGCPRASHVHALPSETSSFAAVGFHIDAIDGFVYPKTQSPQPPNTAKLCRKYDPNRDDYILFAGAGVNGGDCSGTTDGFSGGNYTNLAAGTDWVGYVHPVQAPAPVFPPAPPTCSSAAPVALTTSGTSGIFNVYAYGVSSSATRVMFPTWGDLGGQDDLIWYDGVNQGGGVWRVDINLANHKAGNPEYGNFNTHVYAFGSDGQPHGCATTTWSRLQFPTCSSATPVMPSTIATSGIFSVLALGVTHGATRVMFPTWGDVGGQDDLIWYDGINLGGGTWRVDIDLANHKAGNPEFGNFNTHVYAFGSDGQPHGCAGTTWSRLTLPTCTSATPPGSSTNATSGIFNIYAFGVSHGTARVMFPTWGEAGGQDDIVWYDGVNLGSGTWRADINMANHKAGNPEFGAFDTHVYAFAPGGQAAFCAATGFSRVP
jgi:hypothetical protein